MRWVLLALIYSLAGCMPTEVWYVDSRFTSDERREIDRAASTWEAVGHPLFLVHGHKVTGQEESGKHIVRGTERTADQIAAAYGDKLTGKNVVGKYLVYPGKEGLLIIADRHRGTPLWQIVAHEMGHAIGLNHVADERALMYDSGTLTSLRCITRADINELCRVSECASGLRGCDE